MDEFDKAEIRAEKLRAKNQRYQPPVENPYGFKEPVITSATLHLPKAKAPAKRTNEMTITVYCDGNVYEYTVRVNLNDIISSQQNRAGIKAALLASLSGKFGRVEIT